MSRVARGMSGVLHIDENAVQRQRMPFDRNSVCRYRVRKIDGASPRLLGGMHMTMQWPEKIVFCEVGPRDGLQNEATLLSVEQKVALIEGVVNAGVRIVFRFP